MFWLAASGGFFIGLALSTLFWAFVLAAEEYLGKEMQKIKNKENDNKDENK